MVLAWGVSAIWGADASRVSNGVWPLSNGLTFELGPQAVLDRFGLPVMDETSADAKFRQIVYRDFSAFFEADSGRMLRLELRGATALASGIRIGTAWSTAISTFGVSADDDDRLEVDLPGYRLTMERLGAGVGAIQLKRGDRGSGKSRAAKATPVSKIEPLSNGVFLSGSADEVVIKMGPPEQDDRRHPAVRLLIYNSLQLQFEGRGQRLNRATIVTADVALACGVAVGTTKARLKQAIPTVEEGIVGTPLRYVEGGFVVSFWLQDDRVSRIELRRVSGGGERVDPR